MNNNKIVLLIHYSNKRRFAISLDALTFWSGPKDLDLCNQTLSCACVLGLGTRLLPTEEWQWVTGDRVVKMCLHLQGEIKKANYSATLKDAHCGVFWSKLPNVRGGRRRGGHFIWRGLISGRLQYRWVGRIGTLGNQGFRL